VLARQVVTRPSGSAEKSVGRFGRLGVYIRMEATTPTTEAPPQQDRLLRPDQAAWYLNVRTSWVYEAVRAGRLPCHRVGRHIRFTRPMLDEWLAQQPRQ
jgi:excisionase family DNA binding protein